jgi:hypothetical protein
MTAILQNRNVKLTLLNGDVVTLNLGVGVLHPVAVKRVWSTGTDATVLAGRITAMV